MKKILITLIIAISSLISFSQSYEIKRIKDKMTDKEYAIGSKTLLCSEDGKKGFAVSISWVVNEGKIEYSGISVVSAGIGNCNESDELIILFEDNSKYSAVSWNEFNCKGNSYFDLHSNDFEKVIKMISAIRFENGRTHDSYTFDLKKDKDFFIDAKKALDKVN